MRSRSILILIIIILFYSCSSKNDGVIGLDNFTELNSQSEGSGTFPFVYNSNANKILDVYCHIPEIAILVPLLFFYFMGIIEMQMTIEIH